MKKYRTLTAFILIILLTAVIFSVGYFAKIYVSLEISSDNNIKAEGMLRSLHYLDDHIERIKAGLSRKTTASAELMSMALQNFITENGYDGPEIFEDGVVVRLEKERIIYPDNSPFILKNISNSGELSSLPPFTQETLVENGTEREVLITVKPINETLYYIDWAEMDDYHAVNVIPGYIERSIEALENVFESGLILLSGEDSESEPLYTSNYLQDSELIADSATLREMTVLKPSEIKLGKTVYNAYYEDLDFSGIKVKALLFMNAENTHRHVYICIGITLAFIIWSTLTMLFYLQTTSQGIPNLPPQEKGVKDKHMDKITSRIATGALVNAVFLLIILIGYLFFTKLAITSNTNQKVLNMLIDRLENSSKQDAIYREDEETWDIFCARRIADLYANYPELQTKEFLTRANQIIGSKYIMTFDKNGDEVISSNAYIGFQLGREIPSTDEFRYLLQGVEQIVHDPEPDFYSENQVQLVGSRMAFPGNAEYGVLVIAFNSLATWESDIKQEIADFLTRLTPNGNLSMIADSGTNKILYSSNPELTNKNANEIGLEGFNTTIPTSLASFKIYGKEYYGAFDQKEPYFYYYMEGIESTLKGILVFPAYASIAYFIITIFLGFILRDPEFEKHYQQAIDKEFSRISSDPNIAGKQAFDEYLSDEKISLNVWEKHMKPEEKFLFILRVLLIGVLIAAFLLSLGPLGEGFSVFKFILAGNWQRGVNEMALIAIITVICILLIFLFLKNLLVKVLCRGVNAKSETIIRLVSSLVHYIAIISAIFLSLAYLGIDTQMLITSASILTLAVSLGSKDLVSDILAGIFIIFGGDFHVGDFVEVNGFTGRVLDIGIRSTRLIDQYQNIKIIDNQSIKSILNMSQELTKFSITLNVTNDDRLDEILNMLKEELPKIGESKPEILSGPKYSGIKEIGYRRVILSISTICRQEDYSKMKKYINYEIVKLFHKHGFPL